jgi:hypothetical protein
MTDLITWGSLPDGVILADTAQDDAISDWSLQPSRQADVAPLVRAAHPSVRDRGNTAYNLSFTNARLHDSPVAARAFILAHAADVQALSQTTARALTVRYEAGGILIRTFLQAVLTAWPATARGCTTIHQYTLVCAHLT